ncbi:MAG: FAD-dependent oxidoreductase [Desulfobacterales bacterium]
MKVIVVGGGWAGCACALAARKKGAQAVLLERMDILLGTGLVGGIMRNNGRFTAAEELLAMGGGELFQLTDANSLHRRIDFPGHRHASIYNVATMEPIVKRFLIEKGVDLRLSSRITDVEMEGDCIRSISWKKDGEIQRLAGDVFVDTTGTAGPPANCNKYGNGCAMCVLRCHSFGGRVSLAAKAGVKEMIGRKGDQTGAMSGSCKLLKESLASELRDLLDKTGVAVVPIPKSKVLRGKLAIKACQQYALTEFEENVVLLDTGHAKLMTPFFPLEALREIPGFENARYEDPYAGGLGNSMRYFAMAPRDDALKVEGVVNLFCAGEKAGLLVGHTEAICTGTLAGCNAVRHVRREEPLVLPEQLAIGTAVRMVRRKMRADGELGLKFTFSGSVLFDHMRQQGLYSTDALAIAERVDAAGLTGVFE